jgi:hypothetical protein
MPRYWDARKLLSLMVRYGSSLPDLLKSASPTVMEGTAANHAPTASLWQQMITVPSSAAEINPVAENGPGRAPGLPEAILNNR